jgi:hypothetical protein
MGVQVEEGEEKKSRPSEFRFDCHERVTSRAVIVSHAVRIPWNSTHFLLPGPGKTLAPGSGISGVAEDRMSVSFGEKVEAHYLKVLDLFRVRAMSFHSPNLIRAHHFSPLPQAS